MASSIIFVASLNPSLSKKLAELLPEYQLSLLLKSMETDQDFQQILAAILNLKPIAAVVHTPHITWQISSIMEFGFKVSRPFAIPFTILTQEDLILADADRLELIPGLRVVADSEPLTIAAAIQSGIEKFRDKRAELDRPTTDELASTPPG